MGKIDSLRSILLLVLLLVVSGVIYSNSPEKNVMIPPVKLGTALSTVGSWKADPMVMEKSILDSLELDDYLFSNYTDGKRHVSLYVGYYYSKNKLGAAHSPLVCYPGQGWVVSGIRKVQYEQVRDKDLPGELAVMKVEKMNERFIAVYWFQSYDRVSSDTFRQKVYSLYQKVTKGKETNAFIRVTVPIIGSDESGALKDAMAFIRDFYPGFLSYVRSY